MRPINRATPRLPVLAMKTCSLSRAAPRPTGARPARRRSTVITGRMANHRGRDSDLGQMQAGYSAQHPESPGGNRPSSRSRQASSVQVKTSTASRWSRAAGPPCRAATGEEPDKGSTGIARPRGRLGGRLRGNSKG